jgi:hypothetical protein
MTSTMTVDPVQLFNEPDPRSKRYEPADRAAAFGTWYGNRSLTKTAQTLGIAVNTIRAWHKDEGWAKRARDADDDAAEATRLLLATKAVHEAEKSLAKIIQLRDSDSTPPKVQLEAAAYILGIQGIAPLKTSAVTLHEGARTGAGQRDDELPDFATMSHDELRAYEERIRKQRKRQVG